MTNKPYLSSTLFRTINFVFCYFGTIQVQIECNELFVHLYNVDACVMFHCRLHVASWIALPSASSRNRRRRRRRRTSHTKLQCTAMRPMNFWRQWCDALLSFLCHRNESESGRRMCRQSIRSISCRGFSFLSICFLFTIFIFLPHIFTLFL